MNLLYRFDEALIDRVYQPIVEVCRPWTEDCVEVAQACAYGIMAFSIVLLFVVLAEAGRGTPAALIEGFLFFCGLFEWNYHRRLRGTIKGTSPYRSHMRWYRLGIFATAIWMSGYVFWKDDITLVSFVSTVRFFLIVSASYFVACSNLPPAVRYEAVPQAI